VCSYAAQPWFNIIPIGASGTDSSQEIPRGSVTHGQERAQPSFPAITIYEPYSGVLLHSAISPFESDRTAMPIPLDSGRAGSSANPSNMLPNPRPQRGRGIGQPWSFLQMQLGRSPDGSGNIFSPPHCPSAAHDGISQSGQLSGHLSRYRPRRAHSGPTPPPPNEPGPPPTGTSSGHAGHDSRLAARDSPIWPSTALPSILDPTLRHRTPVRPPRSY